MQNTDFVNRPAPKRRIKRDYSGLKFMAIMLVIGLTGSLS